MQKNEDLDYLILNYAENKTKFEAVKKLCDKQNAQIKAIMAKLPEGTYIAGEYKASYSVSQRTRMDESTLLSLFTTVPGFNTIAEAFGIVKTKEYIDFDALEKALYSNQFSDSQLLDLGKAKESKEVVTLCVTKIKKRRKSDVC